jgi:putative membrane protein
MKDNLSLDELALDRTLLAAERTFSAWTRTGLAAMGGGLAVVRALVFNSDVHKVVSLIIGGMLVILGAGIFVYAIVGYRRIYARLTEDGLSKNSSGAVLITAVLLIVAALVLWIIFQ